MNGSRNTQKHRPQHPGKCSVAAKTQLFRFRQSLVRHSAEGNDLLVDNAFGAGF